MLPSNLAYNNNVEASQGRSFRSNTQPQTGSSFKSGETLIFNIPTRQNLVLSPSESYLRGKVTFKNGATASNYIRMENAAAHTLFYRLQVYHGSNLLQTIENYPLLAKLMFDLQVSTPQANGKHSILTGCSTEYVVSSSIGDAADAAG